MTLNAKITHNFDQMPETNEIWIKIDGIVLKVFYEDGKHFEGLKMPGEDAFVLKQMNFEDENGQFDIPEDLLAFTIAVYEVLCDEKEDNEFMFAGRYLNVFNDAGGLGLGLSIQTGEEDANGEYSCDMRFIDKAGMRALANFFKKAECLFLNLRNGLGRDFGWKK